MQCSIITVGILPKKEQAIVEKVVRKFESFAEAEKADLEFYRSLTGEQRLQILLELVARGNANAPQRFERVYRIVELDKR